MPTEMTPPPARAVRAHALKNCLTVISAINRLVESELSERSRERLARAQQTVCRMRALIEQDLAEEELAGASECTYVTAEMIVRGVVARVEDRAEAARVELFVQAGRGGVVGDGAELTEALANIVLNAIDATPAGGCVYVATRERPDGSQLWAVRDMGPGVPEHIKERLGAPFVTGRRGGSGLGLAMARQAFERHGGQMQVRSMRGSGTTVSMHLPSVSEGADRACAGF